MDALTYSYNRDIRFVLLICLLLGFSIWWFLAPELLLFKPAALCSPDLDRIVRVIRETYLNQVCSTHQVPLPCECGYPLNKVAVHLFSPEEIYDPLGLGINPPKKRSIAVFVAMVVLSLVGVRLG